MPKETKGQEGSPCTDWRPADREWLDKAARNGIRIQLGTDTDPASSEGLQDTEGVENMTEGYHITGPDKEGMYSCEDCGHWFTVPEGEPVECPICKQILNCPELKPCPFCGGPAYMDWEIRDREREDNHHQLQVICRECGAETALYDLGTVAAEKWNHRVAVEASDRQELKPCPFCGGPAIVQKFRDPEVDRRDYPISAFYHVASCSMCGVRVERSENSEDPETTIDAWNRRIEE